MKRRERPHRGLLLCLFLPLGALCVALASRAPDAPSPRSAPGMTRDAGRPPVREIARTPERAPTDRAAAHSREEAPHEPPPAHANAGRGATEASSGSDDEHATIVLRTIDAVTGEPVANAAIEIGHTPRGVERESVFLERSDHAGLLRLELLPGELRIVAWGAASTSSAVFATVESGEALRRDLELRSAHSVRGRIVDATTGLPVAGARVSFWTFAELDTVRSGSDGSFHHPRFPSAEGSHQIHVAAEGYGKTVRYFEVGADGLWRLPAALASGREELGRADAVWIELELVPELLLTGRIADAFGRPIAGARICAEGFFHLLPTVASRDEAQTWSESDGSFVLAGLRSDIGHSVLASHDGYGTTSIEVPGGEQGTRELGELRLAGSASITGLVLDPQGRPAVDIEVRVENLAAPRAGANESNALDVPFRLQGRLWTTRTCSEGTFSFHGVAPEKHRVIVLRDARPLITADLDPASVPTEETILRLPQESLTLTGCVRESGRPVAEALVELRRNGRVALVRTDRDGSFRISGLDAELPYRVIASGRSGTCEARVAESSVWAFEQPVLELGESFLRESERGLARAGPR